MWQAYVYLIGLLVGLVMVGYIQRDNPKDEVVIFVMGVIIWPLSLTGVVLYLIVMAPVSLGSYIHKVVHNERPKGSRD